MEEKEMSKKKEKANLDSFQAWCHRWGRIGTVIALIYMIALPFIVLGVYDCMPSVGDVFNLATMGILMIYIPVLLIGDTIQALVMLTGLVVAVALGVLASKPKLHWLADFIMAFSMIAGMASSLLWLKLFS